MGFTWEISELSFTWEISELSRFFLELQDIIDFYISGLHNFALC